MKKKSNHGGKREGAGPPLKHGEPTVAVNVRLPISVVSAVDAMPGTRSEIILQSLRLLTGKERK